MNPSHVFATPRAERFFLLVLAGIQFTNILDFMIMMPLGPQFIRLLGIDTHHFGLLLSSYTFASAASGFIAAGFIDRFDRRTLMLTAYTLFTLSTLACGLAPSYEFLLVARGLAGIFGGVLGSLCTTMVADVIPFERRGKAMGMIMLSFSLSTVAGVPLGLLLANHIPQLAWRAPFFFIVVLALCFLAMAWRVIPSLNAHVAGARDRHPLRQVIEVARKREHLKAFLFMALIMMTGFAVIPYIALYTTANVGIAETSIPLIYLCGGIATLVTSQLFGRLADKYGKARVFQYLAVAALVPMMVTTNLVPVPLWVVLINSTCFFVLTSGRMIPGMALVSQVAAPHVRGTFMSLLSSVQSAAGGLATLLGGLIISRTAGGQIEHYNVVGYMALATGIATIFLVRGLQTAPAAAMPAAAPAAAPKEEAA